MGAGYIGSGKQHGDSETAAGRRLPPRPTDVIFRWATAKRLLHVKF